MNESADLANWMQGFPEETIASIYCLPGTHHSGTGYDCQGFVKLLPYRFFCKTQTLSVSSQLLNGVRVLDLRLNREAEISHTISVGIRIRQVLREVVHFLQHHPCEFIVILLRMDHGSKCETDTSTEILSVVGSLPLFDRNKVTDGVTRTRFGSLAGNIVLCAPTNSTLLDMLQNRLSVFSFREVGFDDCCPIWDCQTMNDAHERIMTWQMQGNPTVRKGRGGVCLDAHLSLLYRPTHTGKEINAWFLERTEKQDDRIGILIMDAVCVEVLRKLIARNRNFMKNGRTLCVTDTKVQGLSNVIRVGPSHGASEQRQWFNCREIPELSRANIGDSLRVIPWRTRHPEQTFSCKCINNENEFLIMRTDKPGCGWGDELWLEILNQNCSHGSAYFLCLA